MTLREEVALYVGTAMKANQDYTGNEPDLNFHNWVQIATDKIIKALLETLPTPIDIEAKYESNQHRGVWVAMGEESKFDKDKLVYLARFADDCGYNRYYTHLIGKFGQEYLKNLPAGVSMENTGDIYGKETQA